MHGGLTYFVQQIPGLMAVTPTYGVGIDLALQQNIPLSNLNILMELRGGGEDNDKQDPPQSFEDIFESHPSIDYSDNREQVKVIKHHYMNEFGKHLSLNEVMKDYSPNTVIHEVIDNVPKSYHGREGVQKAFKDLYRKIPHDTSHMEFEHIAIDHDHAQVVWKAEIPDDDVVIRGMDSFAFDSENRITNQSTMAISSSRSKLQEHEEQRLREAVMAKMIGKDVDHEEVKEVSRRRTLLGKHFSGMY